MLPLLLLYGVRAVLCADLGQAATKVTVSPKYVPAIYCSYKSKDWVQKGIVTCPTGWDPIGEPGATLEGQQGPDQLLEHVRRRR